MCAMTAPKSKGMNVLKVCLLVPLFGGGIEAFGVLIVTLYRLFRDPELLGEVRVVELIWLPVVMPIIAVVLYFIPSLVLASIVVYGGFLRRAKDYCVIGGLGGLFALVWSWLFMRLMSSKYEFLFFVDLLGIFGCGALASVLIARIVLPSEKV
jgi:hypothetical protein